MRKVNSLNLVRFLSAIFHPFSHVTEEQREKMAEELFGKVVGKEILSELRQSYRNVYCDGEKYLTPSNVLFAIQDSADAWREKDVFVINTSFSRDKDQFHFRKELATLFSHYTNLRRFIPSSIKKINQKYVQKHKEVTKSTLPGTIWNLYRYLNSYRIDTFDTKTNYAINAIKVSDANTLADTVLEITDGELLVLFLTSIALCKSDNLFYDELIEKSRNVAVIKCTFAALLANRVRFLDEQTSNDHVFAYKLIDKIKDRPDRFSIFAELIDCCERIGTDKSLCHAIVDAVFCFIEKYLGNTKKYAKSLHKLFLLLYQFSSMKSIGYFADFHSNEMIENKLLNEILKFYVPKLNPENLSAFNISIDSLNILIKGFTCCYEEKPQRLSLFSRLNNTFSIYFEKEKSQAISISSNIAMLNLLTIELLTYDALISAGHNELMTKVTKIWKIFDHWLPSWDFHLLINQNEIYPKIYSIFKCKNYKNLIEQTLLNLNNHPFPYINSTAVIFNLYPDLKNKYSFFILDYVLRYKNHWEKERIENLLNTLKFAGFKETELKMLGM